MSGSQFTKQKSQMKALAAWGALAFGGVGVFALATDAADEPVQQRSRKAVATEVASIDGAEIFAREWIPGDARSHGGDGLGPVFNDSSCVACHNQGGIGGGGPASKNVDIVTAFHTPMNQQRHGGNAARLPTTLPGLVFQSVFGNLDNVPQQAAQPTVKKDQADPTGDPQKQLTAAERAAEQKKNRLSFRRS